jgi:restriction system protein
MLCASSAGQAAKSEVVEQVASDLELSEDVQNELLDSGAPRFQNQVAWGRFYLCREGLIGSSPFR